jgi:predicted RNA-binding protein with PUA-like domain
VLWPLIVTEPKQCSTIFQRLGRIGACTSRVKLASPRRLPITGEHELAYWLMKSEPDAYSIDDLERDRTEPWDGIRNYQARNIIRDDMKVGDEAFFYHSSCKEPAVVGIMKIASEAYPDPTQFDPEARYYDPKSPKDNPRWMLVEVEFERKLKRPVTLRELKAHPALGDFRLNQRGNRLSIFPVSEAHWNIVLGLE